MRPASRSFCVMPSSDFWPAASTASSEKPSALPTSRTADARAIRDHFGGHAGPFAAIFFVDVLDYFLAAFVLEIDVDVGRFVPLRLMKRSNSKSTLLGIDRRHPQAIADGRIGGRSAPLAQDVASAGETSPGPKP